MANLLTALRVLLLVPFVYWMRDPVPEAAAIAGLLLLAAILTDLLDGPAARRWGTVTPSGRLADHSTDFLLVTGGMVAITSRGGLPWVLPGFVTLAFLQYVFDSYVLRREGHLHMSRLGQINGILYYFPSGGDILIRLGMEFLRPLWWPLVWLLMASTLLSIADRFWSLLKKT